MRLAASRFVLIGSVALAFGVACSGSSYTTDPNADSGGHTGGSGGGDGETGGNGSDGHDGGSSSQSGGATGSGGKSDDGGTTGSGGKDGSGGEDGSGGDDGAGGSSATGGTTSGGTGGVVSTGGTGTGGGVNTGGTGGHSTGGSSVGGSPSGGTSSGGAATGGAASGGAGTGGSGGGSVCPDVEFTCPKAPAEAPLANTCATDQAAFEDALLKARGCSESSQCTGANTMDDACGCWMIVNDQRCDLIQAAQQAYYVWTVCHSCPLAACPLSIVNQCYSGGSGSCSATSGMCESKAINATE